MISRALSLSRPHSPSFQSLEGQQRLTSKPELAPIEPSNKRDREPKDQLGLADEPIPLLLSEPELLLLIILGRVGVGGPRSDRGGVDGGGGDVVRRPSGGGGSGGSGLLLGALGLKGGAPFVRGDGDREGRH